MTTRRSRSLLSIRALLTVGRYRGFSRVRGDRCGHPAPPPAPNLIELHDRQSVVPFRERLHQFDELVDPRSLRCHLAPALLLDCSRCVPEIGDGGLAQPNETVPLEWQPTLEIRKA